MNQIEKIRSGISKSFDESIFIRGDNETFVSPTGKFRMEATNYWCKSPNLDLTKVEIYEQSNREKLFDFFTNDGQFFFSWLTKNNSEYIVCAEDLCGGQTVIDVTNKIMSGYSPESDGFIWTDFYLSPDETKLATIGCYWACSYAIKVFDFTNPLNLPLPEIREFELLGNDENIIGWADNHCIKTKGIKREQEPEYLEDGGMRFKTISEIPMERLLYLSDM